jgi:hypothetical protein
MFKIPFALIFCSVFFISSGFHAQPSKREKEKVSGPGDIKNILFYVQRSINISALIYELNLNEKEELNVKEPVKIYWKNYATDSSTQGLNYIQKKYAYGIDLKMIDAEKKTFCFNFVSYKKKLIYLVRSPIDNKYRAFCDITGKLVALTKIFVQIEGGSFWFPKIKYIEVSGKDLSKDEEVMEKIIP